MTEDDGRRPGYLWAIIQEWMDAMPYPPSQRDLAKRLEISSSVLSDWKYGEGFPSPERLVRLALEIRVPYERVLDAVLIDRGYRAPHGPTGTRETA
jgi:transcriptional regulator with XRE-family HTH domain